jgi:hypothetical protein
VLNEGTKELTSIRLTQLEVIGIRNVATIMTGEVP